MSLPQCSSPAAPAACRSRMPSSPASSTWVAPRWPISSASSSRCASARPRKESRVVALISYLTWIQFDFGSLALLSAELQLLAVARPLLVTDPGIRSSGLLDRVRDKLPQGHVVYDQTPSNPTEGAVLAALKLYREAGCDGLIALGGGSAMDLAKGVRLLATHPEPLVQYAFIENGAAKIKPGMPPMVAIPTTAGTGSEVGRGAVIIMRDGRKLGIGSPHLIASVALCGPELTLGLSPSLTAGT